MGFDEASPPASGPAGFGRRHVVTASVRPLRPARRARGAGAPRLRCSATSPGACRRTGGTRRSTLVAGTGRGPSTTSAAPPLGMLGVTSRRMKSSSTPSSPAILPAAAPDAAPSAMPKSGTRNSRPMNPPHRAPRPAWTPGVLRLVQLYLAVGPMLDHDRVLEHDQALLCGQDQLVPYLLGRGARRGTPLRSGRPWPSPPLPSDAVSLVAVARAASSPGSGEGRPSRAGDARASLARARRDQASPGARACGVVGGRVCARNRPGHRRRSAGGR